MCFRWTWARRRPRRWTRRTASLMSFGSPALSSSTPLEATSLSFTCTYYYCATFFIVTSSSLNISVSKLIICIFELLWTTDGGSTHLIASFREQLEGTIHLNTQLIMIFDFLPKVGKVFKPDKIKYCVKYFDHMHLLLEHNIFQEFHVSLEMIQV